MRPTNILFTGSPGCGKTSLIEKIAKQIQRPVTGFLTREIRQKGRRVGFAICTLDGREGVLAHEVMQSAVRVGRYGVNLEDVERIAVPSMVPPGDDRWVIIDEIGKMECLSQLFRDTLLEVLDAPNGVIASIALRGDAFVESIKRRSDVHLLLVTKENRDALAGSALDGLWQENPGPMKKTD